MIKLLNIYIKLKKSKKREQDTAIKACYNIWSKIILMKRL